MGSTYYLDRWSQPRWRYPLEGVASGAAPWKAVVSGVEGVVSKRYCVFCSGCTLIGFLCHDYILPVAVLVLCSFSPTAFLLL